MKRGLVLLVHGSRDEAWMAPFEALRRETAAAAPETMVGIACLQFGHPTLAEAIAEQAGAGVKAIAVAPVFISVLGHVLHDVPRVVAQARERFPGLAITVTAAVGEQPELRAAMRACLVRLAREAGEV
jgi:sirohydrochlorin cobaltochelatase